MSTKSLSQILVIKVTNILEPLQELTTPAKIVKFIEELGWDLGDILGTTYPISLDIGQFTTDLGEVIDDIINLSDASDEEAAQIGISLIEKVSGLVTQAIDITKAIEVIINDLQANPPDIQMVGIAIGDVTELMARRLLDLLLYQYLQRYHQRIFSLFHVLGLAEVVPDDAGMLIKTIQWERIPILFTSTGELVNTVYEWNSSFLGVKFLERTEVLLRAFLIPGGIYTQSESVRSALGREIGKDKEIRFPLYQSGIWPDSYTEIDLNLSPIPEKDEQNKAGLFLYPYLMAGASFDMDISEKWKLCFKGNIGTRPQVGFELRPPAKLQIVNNAFDGNPESLINIADAHVEVGIVRKTANDELSMIFGSEDGSYLGFREIGFNFITALDNGKEEIAAEMLINDLSLKIDISEGDGFIQKLLSGIKVESVTDLTIGVSNQEGFYFQGSSALSIEIPIHKSIGPITIDSVLIGVDFGEKIEVLLAVSLGFELGPVIGSVDTIGLKIPITISDDNSGNFGPVQIDDIEFLPPTGVGLAIAAGPVVGGGFIDFDETNQRYSGALALQLGEIGITAVGLIATQMPDGSEGYSMLVNIGVTFNPSIQIYAGISLAGVGGLVGINRTMDTEVLQEGLKKGTLDSILFPDPKEVIKNANQIISDMRSVFPPEEGRFVVGPMLIIGYGIPTILTGEIGVFVETPEPVRIALMGQVEMALPDAEFEIVGIHIDILGTLDTQKKELSFQASIQGSGMGAFELYGDCAFFLRWGDTPELALAIGGFHPSFTAPSPRSIFSDLKQLRLNLNYGPLVQLRLGGYLALTPNTLQFGARIELFIGVVAVEAGISGFLSFDALFNFSPFSFESGMTGGMAISVMGVDLANISVNCTLSGPTPWTIRGTATVHVLFWDVDCGFNETWGLDDPKLAEPVNPWLLLKGALGKIESWGSQLPLRTSLAVALRSIEDEPVNPDDVQPPAIVVHPAGRLEVRQNVVPFETTLERFGSAPPKTYDRFRIVDIQTVDSDGNEIINVKPIDEYFSRGQFEILTKHQKLSLPSFEKMQGGATTGSSDRIEFKGDSQSQKVEYESIMIKSDRTTQPADNLTLATAKWSHARFLSAGNSVSRVALCTQGNARFAYQGESMVGTQEEQYSIVNAETLIPIDIDPCVDVPESGMTRMQADQALAQHLVYHPEESGEYIVVAAYEAEEVA
ncbi:MAG: hypothetical protein K8S56_00820 [Candidatus Cloacimonetes bacterium]|nr:hypothetical protein [Candidatus Cloacimonadota bacterium]